MKIGIGLPASIPGVSGERLVEWAKRADSGPFSSLGVIDRLVYPNYEPLVTLAVAAGATRRIRLMSTVLVAPLRNAGILAKQSLSLDNLSGGRFTLGLGVGAREDDFQAAPAPFPHRGRRFEEQLTLIRRIWSGEAVNDTIGPIGPKAFDEGGPELLIGGYSSTAIRRVGRWGDGIIAGSSSNVAVTQHFYTVAQEAWQAAARSGQPRLVSCKYYALGPDAAERGGAAIRDYYSFNKSRADDIANTMPTTPAAVRQIIQQFADIGTDEFILWPCITDLDQIDQLAELIE